MDAANVNQFATSGPSRAIRLGPHEIYALDLLRLQAQGVLAPSPADGITQVTLRTIVLIFENLRHQILTITAQNTNGCYVPAAINLELVPKGARIGQATVDVLFAGSAVPHSAEIHPRSLKVQDPADAPRIAAFLSKRHLTAVRKIAGIAAILLALATAIIPDAYTDIDDDDDDHDHPIRLAA